ncbi:unnamed protein product [Larinioides sclopetarius]|uniref:Uncharacterized protein n=1 Tax=Larinioides sclopetarius TaxID=280406 RepID=A0AAV2BAV9_9ARAC
MATASADTNIRNILERFENTLDFARQQLLEDSPERENQAIDLNSFWTNFRLVCYLEILEKSGNLKINRK